MKAVISSCNIWVVGDGRGIIEVHSVVAASILLDKLHSVRLLAMNIGQQMSLPSIALCRLCGVTLPRAELHST
jgi:hypothetical protein